MLVRGYWEAPDMVIESGAGRPEQHDRKLQKQCMRMVLISHSRYTGRGPPPTIAMLPPISFSLVHGQSSASGDVYRSV